MQPDNAQGSDGWLLERCGYVTASGFKAVLSKGRSGGESITRKKYMTRLAIERITGKPVETFHNGATDHGNLTETEARAYAETVHGIFVKTVGFVRHPRMKWVGASPDGLIEAPPKNFPVTGKGGIEIKCPQEEHVHIETCMTGVPSEHAAQIQGNMWVNDCTWWLFCSYHAAMPDNLKLFSRIVLRDDVYVKNLAIEVSVFLKEVQELHDQLINWKG